ASALQTMGSTVSQQGQQLAADGKAITDINATLTQVKTDVAANASATSGLSGRVIAGENNLTSVSGQVTELKSSLG
ncbi:hypothetical protein, partial [Pseudomonas sp. GW460-LB5]|uniref:hypothetical protein n=1 Tax=Pseudomonas sp. GW460-LB5 TaxID=2751366 RepID=UPI001A92D4FB